MKHVLAIEKFFEIFDVHFNDTVFINCKNIIK